MESRRRCYTMVGVFANRPEASSGFIYAGDRYFATDEGVVYTATPSLFGSLDNSLEWVGPTDIQFLAAVSIPLYACVQVSAGGLAPLSGPGLPAIGVCQNEPIGAGFCAVVRCGGTTWINTMEPLLAGDVLAGDAGGLAKTAVRLVAGAGSSLVGVALTNALAGKVRGVLTLGGAVPTNFV